MILIVDSGSTKSDWALIDDKGNRKGDFETMGLNPYFHNDSIIEKAILDNKGLAEIAKSITHIFFYGAGSSTPEMCGIMKRGLQLVFKKAEILVDHDLLGSAMSTYDGETCVACILGTGSNSCRFDGHEVYEEIPSLAYILGDEASGSWFGKILLKEYFYKRLPADLRVAFEKYHAPSKDEIINRIYREPNANVYLASFMKFIGEHKQHPHVERWIVDGMMHFIDIHVKCYKGWESMPIHFVGSIGHHFRRCLEIAANETGIRLGCVIQKPIDGLVAYHVRWKLPSLVKTT